MSQCFSPGVACPRFGWSGWNPNRHNFIVVDEMNFTNYMLETWKTAVTGNIFFVERKNQNGQHPIYIRCPMILCSNLSIEHYLENNLLAPAEIDAIKARLEIVHCSVDGILNKRNKVFIKN